ncbi:biliverdin-producing heme oxygenase (plasmid) [Paroceanicella profunda]|uniref:Biliverdin-producing heme oxygenase n=1 Tax=Paroceanicella profunda TaxID=2579971 RepID=A0A5B8FJL0_9RHOB|nr:biliverdin-producing heme oxygenase [Paroceanicella profunda]QDL94438.1 biliverdin-producing heme oxygenase [Paroceanicella profunda]
MSEASVRDHLRQATAGLHEAVDAAYSTLDLSRREDYGRFLLGHARALPGLEAALAASPEFARLPDAAARLRLPALRADLAALGHAMPRALDVSYVNEAGAGLGIAYVLEGSRLGARVLSKRAAAGSAPVPLQFLHHGVEERFWGGFLHWAARESWSKTELSAATQAARAAFRTFLEGAAGPGPVRKVPD